jgi:hypothetical protein
MDPGLCLRTRDVDCAKVRDDVSVGFVGGIRNADCGDGVGGVDWWCEGYQVKLAEGRDSSEVMVLLMRRVSQI